MMDNREEPLDSFEDSARRENHGQPHSGSSESRRPRSYWLEFRRWPQELATLAAGVLTFTIGTVVWLIVVLIGKIMN